MIDGASAVGEPVIAWLAATALQVTLVALVIWLLDRWARDHVGPQIRYGLWMLVAVKLALPPWLPALWSPWITVDVASIWNGQGVVPFPLSSPAQMPLPPETSPLALTVADASDGSAIVGTLPTLLLGVWLAGAVLVAAVIWTRSRRLRRRLLHAARPASPRVTRAARQAATALGVASPPPVWLSRTADGPLVTGCLRAVVVLPTAATGSWNDEELRHVLCHELAHVKRRDLWTEAAFAALNALYWFHPLVWLARRRAAELRELCCDATAARAAGSRYRETLTRIAAGTLLRRAGAGAIGFTGRRSTTLARLRQLDRQRPTTGLHRLIRATALLACAVLLLPLATASTSGSAVDVPASLVGAAPPDAPTADTAAVSALRDAEIAAARRTVQAAVDKTPGYGSLHARYGLMRWNAALAAGADHINDRD